MSIQQPAGCLRLSLVDEITATCEATSVRLESVYGIVEYTDLPAGIVGAFKTLAAGGADRASLESKVLDSDGLGGLSRFGMLLDRSINRCFIDFTVWSDAGPMISLHPTVPTHAFSLSDSDADTIGVVSRFAYCRWERDLMVIESPLARSIVNVHDPDSLKLWATFGTASSARCAAESCGLCLDEAIAIVGLLRSAKAIVDVGNDERPDEEQRLPLLTWDFHDLLFHTRSRVGRHNRPTGGTFRFAGEVPPLPLSSEPRDAPTIPLASARAESLRPDVTLVSSVIEQRRSIRRHGDTPLTVDDLGEFLYRVARLRLTAHQEIRDEAGDLEERFEIGSKPYPSGGGLYELEIYPVVHSCRGLEQGMYHYDSKHHQLEVLSPPRPVRQLLDDAQLAAGVTAPPQILLVISARFGRVAWKYESIAYSAILKNVGSLFQTMYLVATSMALAPCGLGSGNSELFADLAGLDYLAETSVGEFMLGSAPAHLDGTPDYITDIQLNSEVG